jgi:hypothetical protein
MGAGGFDPFAFKDSTDEPEHSAFRYLSYLTPGTCPPTHPVGAGDGAERRVGGLKRKKKGIDDDMSSGIEEEEEVCVAGILKARQQRQPI